MLCFKSLKGRDSVEGLIGMGFEEGDLVAVLFADGSITCGKLQYITEYSTVFDVNILVNKGWDYKTISILGALGISEACLED